MRPPPKHWPRMSLSVFYDDPRAAIAFLTRAFGFEVRTVIDDGDGGVAHSELTFDEAVIMVGKAGAIGISPRAAGRATSAAFIYVEDADTHYARAKAAGAAITRELATTDYGDAYWVDRGYGCTDPEGHAWHFAHRVRDAAEE